MIFYVRVYRYSLEPNRVGLDMELIYTSTHRSSDAACRRLASLINSKNTMARTVQRDIGAGNGGRYAIQTDDGQEESLLAFRARMNNKE